MKSSTARLWTTGSMALNHNYVEPNTCPWIDWQGDGIAAVALRNLGGFRKGQNEVIQIIGRGNAGNNKL